MPLSPRHSALLRTFLGRALTFALAGLMFFAIDRAVRATPGGQTREMLSFAGTLRQNGQPLAGQQSLTFTFKKGGTTICAPQVMVTPDSASGSFNTQIDVSNCASTLFDGGDVVFDLSVGGNVIAMAQPINAVPYAKYSDRYGSPDCPVGYARDAVAMGIVLCKKGTDEMVKVGTGATAFWIDRYESSLWQNPDGTGQEYGLTDGDAHAAGFSHNGQWTLPLYARSVNNVQPAQFVTWFQSDVACRLSGKRLATGPEWLMGANGTSDPGSSVGLNGACLTAGNAARRTGQGNACQSRWGGQDFIGNLYEWTGDWDSAAGTTGVISTPWQPDYNADIAENVGSSSWTVTQGPLVPNLPSAVRRGGWPGGGTGAGIFAISLMSSPSFWEANTGFRCVIPR